MYIKFLKKEPAMFKVFLAFLESIYRNPIAKYLLDNLIKKGKAFREDVHKFCHDKSPRNKRAELHNKGCALKEEHSDI